MKSDKCKKIIILMGPTSSGKTELAITLRKFLPVEIISVDSAMIYRDMDIGTAKPTLDELLLHPHRLINTHDPSQSYSVANFFYDVKKEVNSIINTNRIPLLVGGCMMYFKVLLNGLILLPPANYKIRYYIEQKAKKFGWNVLYNQVKQIDPAFANRIHPHDFKRILRALEVFLISGNSITDLSKNSDQFVTYPIYHFILTLSSQRFLHQRIVNRFYHMLDIGFEQEVQKLFIRGDLRHTMPSIQCIGYRQMWSYLSGSINYNQMISQTIYATKQLAKHQITWLRKWHNAYWLYNDQLNKSIEKILKIINYT